MKNHKRLWIVLAIAVVLIAGHSILLYYVSTHVAVSTAVIVGVIVLVLVQHLGLLGPFYALFRRPNRH